MNNGVAAATESNVMTIDHDAYDSFLFILDLIEQGVTFAVANRTRAGLMLTVEKSTSHSGPTHYVFPALAVAHDTELAKIASDAISTAMQVLPRHLRRRADGR